MWLCSNTESVPLLVSNTHDIILVRTKYVLVCTSLYDYTFPVPVCTRYVPVHTVILSVSTKYPDPVPLVTIPDGFMVLQVTGTEKKSGSMYSTIGSGTASQATPQGRRHNRAGLGFKLTIKRLPALCLDH